MTEASDYVSGVALSELSAETLRGMHPELDIDPPSFFSPDRSLEARRGIGAPSRKSIGRSLEAASAELEQTRAELEAQT